MSVPSDTLPASSRELVQLLRATLAGRQPAVVTDWPTLLQQAMHHGVDAFLYPALLQYPADQQPPPAIMARWRQQSLYEAVSAVHREAQTRELLAALTEAHIRAVPLKGAWLATHVYPEPGQRPMCDIDLLVPPQELARAQEALRQLGYTPQGIIASIELDSDQTYTCPRHAWPLELHWSLGVAINPPLHQPKITHLEERLVPETLLGVPILALCPEEQLVHLAYHILHHRFVLPLRGYLDIALLSRQLANDAACRRSLQTIAAEWGMTHALPRIISVTCDLFDQEPPLAIADWPPAEEGAQHAQVLQLILASSEQCALSAERTLLEFQQRHLLARIGLLVRRICMPRAFLQREYACARWWFGLPLAYLLRARDLLRRNSGAIRKTLQHDPAMTQRLDVAATRERLLLWALTGKSN